MARASLAALLFLFVACSDDGPMTETCIPGASVACTCPDGTMGAQVCTAEGTFNPCSCSPGADAGAVDAGDDGPDAGGADGGAPDDGGAESDGAVAGWTRACRRTCGTRLVLKRSNLKQFEIP